MVPLSKLQRVLQNLLGERVPVRSLRSILEAMADELEARQADIFAANAKDLAEARTAWTKTLGTALSKAGYPAKADPARRMTRRLQVL